CGLTFKASLGLLGSSARLTMPPMRTEPVNFGLKGSDTSYCRISPVPQHATYRKRSSSERLMSETSGGTALNPLSNGGNCSASAGSAGISMIFRAPHLPLSRCQTQIEAERSFSEITTPAKPKALLGSC